MTLEEREAALGRLQSEGERAKGSYEAMAGFPGSGYASRLGVLMLEGAVALASSIEAEKAANRRLEEVEKQEAAVVAYRHPPSHFSGIGAWQEWKEKTDRLLKDAGMTAEDAELGLPLALTDRSQPEKQD